MITRRLYQGIVGYYTVDWTNWLAARGFTSGDIQSTNVSIVPSDGTLVCILSNQNGNVTNIWVEHATAGEEYTVLAEIVLTPPGPDLDPIIGPYQFRLQGYF